MLVGFGATSKHCALYVFSGTTLGRFEDDLQDYDHSKGAVRFDHGEPPPMSLVQKLVKARVAENEDAARKKTKRAPPRSKAAKKTGRKTARKSPP